MKIVLASTWKARCGISTYTSYLAEELAKNNQVTILSEYPEISGVDETQKVEVPNIPCWNRYEDFSKIPEEIKKLKSDILHIQHEFGLFGINPIMSNNFLDVMAKINIPKVITYHSVPLVPHPFFKDYFLKSDKEFGGKIFHNQVALSHAVNTYNVKKATHINHGVKICDLLDKEYSRNELNIGCDSSHITLLSMGYFGGLKGVMELINMFSKFKERWPYSMFIYAGGLHPPTAKHGKKYMVDCMKHIIKLGLKNDFIITGYLPEDKLPTYYSAADIFVLNYMNSGYISASGCSAKLVAARRPIVTTHGTFRNEELVDGKTCLKVKEGDMDEMLTTIEKLVRDRKLYDGIVEGAYEYAKTNSWQNIAKQHETLYREVLS